MFRNFPQNCLSLYLVGPKNPAKFPPNFPAQNFKKKLTDNLLQERREKPFCAFQYSLRGWHGPGSGFGSWRALPTVAVPTSVRGKNGSDCSGFLFRFGCYLHRVLQGAPPRGRQLYFTSPSAPDPLFKAWKAPFLTLRVATPSGAPRQAPLDILGVLARTYFQTSWAYFDVLAFVSKSVGLLWLQIGRGDLRWKICILKIALFISGSRHNPHPTTPKIPPWVIGGPLGQQWPSLWHSCAQARARRRRGRHKDTEKVRETQGMSALWTL